MINQLTRAFRAQTPTEAAEIVGHESREAFGDYERILQSRYTRLSPAKLETLLREINSRTWKYDPQNQIRNSNTILQAAGVTNPKKPSPRDIGSLRHTIQTLMGYLRHILRRSQKE